MGRMTRRTLATKENSQDAPSSSGDIVATDSIPIRTYGAKYDNVHLFIDSFSGYCTVIFGKKNDTSKELAVYTERVRLQYLKYGHIIKTLQTDSLSSYQTQLFEESMLSTGIERRESSPNEHQQNGKVERYLSCEYACSCTMGSQKICHTTNLIMGAYLEFTVRRK